MAEKVEFSPLVLNPYLDKKSDNNFLVDYMERLAKFRAELAEKSKQENTEYLQKRLAALDIGRIDSMNKIDANYLINKAFDIRQYATFCDYDMSKIDFDTLDKAVKAAKARLESLKQGQQETDFAKNIYADTYAKSNKTLF